ncbi:Na+/H+ antiporter [Thorsellia kenyensis]|uniref:Na+/H+ antiporter n=1 Tax=Thorsellia kenyensis TaxID=1549888 RepID=A0ABV6CE23_9GAMM
MDIFLTILVLTLTVSLSGVLTQILPFQAPLPIIQIGLGAILALPYFGMHVSFEPGLFLLLFIPPLLFSDGWKTPLRELIANSREILGLALVFVLITVIGIGYFIHWLLPELPLVAAFALAAVLSPTDAVALSGIVGKGKMPHRLMGVLEGEALMNDASGLVALKFAILVATGMMEFSVSTASVEFIKVAIGGLIAGIAVTWLYSKALMLMIRWRGDDPATQIVMLLLLPFAAYLVAEHLHTSGILAAVAAGITFNQTGVMRQASIATRLRANGVWTMLEFVFNGMVFIMLGLQLPDILTSSIIQAEVDKTIETSILFLYVPIIYLALLILRFSWFYLMKKGGDALFKKKPMILSQYSTKDIFIATFSGVRGAITLAGVLSIPLLMDIENAIPFPGRYQLVFIATGIILLSIIVAIVTLPFLLRGVEVVDHKALEAEQRIAKLAMAEAAIKTIQKMQEHLSHDAEENYDDDILHEASFNATTTLRRRMDNQENEERSMALEALEKRFMLAGLRAERSKLYTLRARKEISNSTMNLLLHDLDLLEAVLIDKDPTH